MEQTMTLSEELAWRGFKAQTTLKDPKLLDDAPKSFYWGTDPSADSLHIGHLAALMMCACFVRHGWKPYFLVGGATGQIGDPKDTTERELKPLEELEKNKQALAAQIIRVTGSKEDTEVLDNLDWFKDIKVLPFLREIGKSFSMTQLLDRQFVEKRIGAGGSGISYAEFSYTLIQGYDFLHLYRTHKIDLQLCGADQFGNCASGIHLIRRLENADAHAYSCPLIIDKATGRKFGKSEGNAVWLDRQKTSVFDFYQFWLGQADSALEEYFKFFTFITPSELSSLLEQHFAVPEKRLGQAELARRVTAIVHGKAAAASAAKITATVFGDNKLSALSEADLSLLSESFPAAPLGSSVLDALVATKLADSKGQARQLLLAGAVSLNGEKITSDEAINELSLLKKGKNKFALVK